ncbi:hypothetical protein GHK92_05410 [Nocardioides sp. dk4132]|uniref:hypothetical protein n=1 Tax=unclassified Nocardioides TaxID=2615069 RepID=UPI001295972B|nr:MULTISPECIES: hypothetical protein [unclassified Nocardioides]MQW75305.1 hypothetical protein [Nocardioides sp. dk4132]QGA07545.1 hypothetical protein GFH29_09200 [Nocardioides sp. dk884]
MSIVERQLEAVRRASAVVDVPGTPLSLRLDRAEVVADRVRLRWSFVDPEVLPGDRESHNRRIRGELEVPLSQAHDETASGWWADVQLAAARRYKQQIDADWSPGEPYVRRIWSVDEAWQALLDHLGRHADVHDDKGGIRVVRGTEQTTYRIDPADWAAYLTGPEAAESTGDGDIVPVGTPLSEGIPVWVADELLEVTGSWEPAVVELVNGELVGRDD